MSTALINAQATKEKVDGVIGVVGDYVILDSDIDLEYIQLRAQGVDVKNITRCELFGKQLEDKLYAHQAIQDSIVVSDAEVTGFMEEQIDAMVEQVGSMDKVLAFYRKKNVDEFRAYFFDIIKNNKLTSQMQKKIFDEVQITPEEVRNFFKEIPKKKIPTFETEKEIRELLKTDINDYFGYLENLKDNEEYEKFFATLEELDQEVRSQYFQGSTAEFKTFLEKHKGSSLAEEYGKLQQKVQMEKYNPVKSTDALEELLKTIVNLYSQISK